MDGHIILPLRGFDPMAFRHMRCTQFRAARMIAKKRRGGLKRDTERQKDRRKDI